MVGKLRALRDNILCVDGNFGEQVTQSGIVIQKTIGKDEGIHPRWFKVFEVGPDINWCQPGQWVYVEYGRWTEGMVVTDSRFDNDTNQDTVWKVDPAACLAISDSKPDGATLGNFTSFRPDTI